MCKLAIVGATGLVGRTVLKILEEKISNFEENKVKAYDEEKLEIGSKETPALFQ